MNKDYRHRIKKTVIIINSVIICLLALSVYRNYSANQYANKLLGLDHSGIIFYVSQHKSELSFAIGAIVVLLCGIVVEVIKARIAVIINVGIPVIALIYLLVRYAKIWPHYDGEAQIGLFLVVLPLFLVCVTYAVLYRRDLRLGH